MAKRKKSGNLVVGACPVPGFTEVAWPEDIDWDTAPTAVDPAIAPEMLRELAPHLPAAFLGALNRERGEGDWRAIAEARRDAGLPPDWDAVFAGGKAPAPDRALAMATGSLEGAVQKMRYRRRIPSHRVSATDLRRRIPSKGQASRKPVLVEIDGVVDNLSGWALRAGIGITTIHKRYRQGDRGRDLLAPAAAPADRLKMALACGLKRKSPADGA